ncbi:hypothetical protein C4K68_09480 [Pokkaliibacter plantistimulans]|uniref:Uncharacterized protein n=1 Tax=Proteobacteria bacterium 228 TaxID=2083153 RepID=A0A2S5KRU5_9PROT|nr:hypothetical protein [Pokkaliibacter plantistimulans]PPC77581.1 hypothetical protein C4K68_09480 [Pokkaliibacter plantistimulans]
MGHQRLSDLIDINRIEIRGPLVDALLDADGNITPLKAIDWSQKLGVDGAQVNDLRRPIEDLIVHGNDLEIDLNYGTKGPTLD